MIESWLTVNDYEGFYEVSNLGNVRSVSRTLPRKFNKGANGVMTYESKLLKPMSTKYEYLKFGLSRDGKVKSFLAHRLVALAWIPNPNNYPVVHHKDHNKHNNAVENLEWTTYEGNTKAAIEAGRHNGGFKRGTKHHSGKFTDDQIQWMSKLSLDGYSYTDLLEIFNSNRGYISQVITGKRRILKEDKMGYQVNCKPIQFEQIYPQ
jgi:hypothetical protein